MFPLLSETTPRHFVAVVMVDTLGSNDDAVHRSELQMIIMSTKNANGSCNNSRLAKTGHNNDLLILFAAPIFLRNITQERKKEKKERKVSTGLPNQRGNRKKKTLFSYCKKCVHTKKHLTSTMS